MGITKQMMFEEQERDEFIEKHYDALEEMDGEVVCHTGVRLLREWWVEGSERSLEGALRTLLGDQDYERGKRK